MKVKLGKNNISLIGWMEVYSHYPSAFTQRAAISAPPAPGQYHNALFVSLATLMWSYSVSPLPSLSPLLSSSRLQARRWEEDRWQTGAGRRGTRTHGQRMAPSQAGSAHTSIVFLLHLNVSFYTDASRPTVSAAGFLSTGSLPLHTHSCGAGV